VVVAGVVAVVVVVGVRSLGVVEGIRCSFNEACVIGIVRWLRSLVVMIF
jgi:hypothetical protein